MESTAINVYGALELVRESAPLVHNITNYVAMNSTANALLAVGASPAMVHAVEEVQEFAGISSALVVNIGTLSPRWVDAMHLAVAQARGSHVPWVLDPVGAGATVYRSDVGAALAHMEPTVIRGNASEIMVLAGSSDSAGKGVDSAHGTDEALESAKKLARDTGAIVAMTGVVDYVTDGERTVAISNGHAMMSRVTALGCTCSAMVGAFLGTDIDPFVATVAAVVVLGVAGEIAAEDAGGPGSLQLRLLDALYSLDELTLRRRMKVAELS
ncbi:MAG TPA: hydroxyethylthiazole kinase [Gemmatimonadaceae bacterium]|jgi:hydroxyethylthiazole kinase